MPKGKKKIPDNIEGYVIEETGNAIRDKIVSDILAMKKKILDDKMELNRLMLRLYDYDKTSN